MAIYIGSTQIKKVYNGATELKALYVGDSSIYSAGPSFPMAGTPRPAALLEFTAAPRGGGSTSVIVPNPSDARAVFNPASPQFVVGGVTYTIARMAMARAGGNLVVDVSSTATPTATALNDFNIAIRINNGNNVGSFQSLRFSAATSAAMGTNTRRYTFAITFARWKGGQTYMVRVSGNSSTTYYAQKMRGFPTTLSSPRAMAVFNNTLYIVDDDSGVGPFKLWSIDPNGADTQGTSITATVTGVSDPRAMTVHNNKLLVQGGSHNRTFYYLTISGTSLTGTQASFSPVTYINAGTSNPNPASPRGMAVLDSHLLVGFATGSIGLTEGIWEINTSTGNAALVRTVTENMTTLQIVGMAAFKNNLFVGTKGKGVFHVNLNVSSGGLTKIHTFSGNVHGLVEWNNRLIGLRGNELWDFGVTI